MRKALHKLKEAVHKLTIKLKRAERQLEIAGNRWQANHDLAHREHKKAKEAERLADKANRQHHPKLAAFYEGRARRCHHRAHKAHLRAEYWVKQAKVYAGKVGHLKEAIRDHDAEIEKIESKLGPKRTAPNKIEDGTERQRLKLFMHLSMKHGSRYYSQEGPADVFHGITGPRPGHRHDCSSWFTSGYCACGLRNPNRDKGPGDHRFSNSETLFTGTIGEHGVVISEHDSDTGDAVLFGVAPFHHIEMKYGKGKLTVGHGSDPIDFGTTDMLPGPRQFRRFVSNS